jgi:hypothetical protein
MAAAKMMTAAQSPAQKIDCTSAINAQACSLTRYDPSPRALLFLLKPESSRFPSFNIWTFQVIHSRLAA